MAVFAKSIPLLIVCAAAEYRRPHPQQQGQLRKQRSGAKHQHLSKGVLDAIFHTLGDSPEDWLVQIRKQLKSTWRSLPKVDGTRVDRHTLRHAVHGHFMQQHGLWIRGLAPPMGSGGSCALGHGQCMWEPAAADALERVLPRYRDEFSLDDAVGAVVALRRRALAADRELLAAAHRHHGAVAGARLHRKKLAEVLTTYTAHWLAGAEHPVRDLPRLNHIPEDLRRIESLVAGNIEAAEERRATAEDGKSLPKQAPWFSPAEAEELASVVTLTFARLWEPQCRAMRHAIAEFDDDDTGYLSLADFHRTRSSGHWHFTESASMLQEMGALEDGTGSRRPRVLIPNYLQAASNCIASTSEYRICCMDECVGFARQVELAVHNSSASPKQLLRLAYEFAPDTHGRPPTKAAAAALQKLAAAQGGWVALHGRAYAHWLHIAFPWTCPLPRNAPVALAGDAAAAAGSMGGEPATPQEEALTAAVSSLQDLAPAEPAEDGSRQVMQEEELQPEASESALGLGAQVSDEEKELLGSPAEPRDAVTEDFLLVAAVILSLGIALCISRMRSSCHHSVDAKLHLG